NDNSTYRMFTHVCAAGSSYVNLGGSISVKVATLPNANLPTDPLMPDLKDIADLQDTGIFSGAYDDEVEGAVADFNNLELNTVFPDKVYKVEKALYGLHQAPRAWYETLSTYLLENRFRKRIIDKTLFIKKDKDDILLMQVYVDDIIFGSTKKSLCTWFKGLMYKKFQMSSMGELTFFLGLQVMQRDDGIFISQDKYVAGILKKFDFSSVKTASTPIKSNKALLKDEEAEDVDVHLNRSMIGSLMYLTASRPNDGISDEFGVKTGSCKVNAARQDLVLMGEKGNADFHQIVDFLNASTISSKSTDWNEFSTNIASAVICLANNQKFNFSKLIFDEKAKVFQEELLHCLHLCWQYKQWRVKVQDNPLNPNQHLLLLHPLMKYKLLLLHHIPQKTHTPRRAKRVRGTEIPQSSGPPKKVGDEAVYTGEDDRVVRAATTATSLEAEQESGNIHKTRSTATLNEPSPQGTGSGSGPRCQDTTLGDTDAQTRFETASKKSCDPPLLEVNTSGSGEDSMEHQDDLTDFVPPTPHDSPLSRGHTPGSDEGRPNINELMAICTNLSNRVLALETSKTAQDLVIKKLKKKVKRLEKKQRARTPGMKLFKIGTSRRKSLDKKNVSKQGKNLKTRPMFEEGDFDDDFDDIDDMVNEAMENVEGNTVNTATTGVSAASASVTTAGVSISTAEPRTPPTTTTTAFEDEDLTIAQTLVKMRSQKDKEKGKGVAFRAAQEESARPTRILPTIDPKDKGKGIMQEPEKPPKNPIKAQIQRDAEIAQRLFEEEQAQFEREQRIARERAAEQEAKDAALIEQMEDIQARMDADELLAERLQQEEREQFTIEEKSRMLVEMIAKRKRFFSA
ncbi:putative ribonuclease H-like domain-containing protein, partial [Tanacetum coccineum]